ncbi:intradiol ring-cleavage dioxygenase [Tepidiforma sp.]|uniref:intradiol ring-cleavage dioxygenase n=1 Tax=Tepidiforma sp. TaxID=2682230 RepID=UPI00261C52C7|nr:intradiol ring-cleavage dioxygenase [Tepidiforma sp.]MCX7617577.1 intradiol ring-cleavage dioxygenase [Tepidiforma sp.]
MRRQVPRIPEHRHDGDDDITDRGLQFDLETLRAQLSRRNALRLFGGVAAIALVGCSDSGSSSAGSGSGTASPAAGNGSGATPSPTAAAAGSSAGANVSPIPTQATPASACTGVIPTETAGPFPGDGSNGPNALVQSGIVRRDIRSSLGISATQAQGVPLTVRLTLLDTKNGCRPIEGAAVYLWHCDREGQYSMYNLPNENYLRGVQASDANGVVTFESIFPGCYAGRWPHIHFEVYPSLEKATSSANKVATSQLAFPQDVCEAVYATAGYEQSARNLTRVSLQTDGIFRDGWQLQLAEMSGSPSQGYTANLPVGL